MHVLISDTDLSDLIARSKGVGAFLAEPVLAVHSPSAEAPDVRPPRLGRAVKVEDCLEFAVVADAGEHPPSVGRLGRRVLAERELKRPRCRRLPLPPLRLGDRDLFRRVHGDERRSGRSSIRRCMLRWWS